MKQIVKKVLQNLLAKRGSMLIKKYELNHLENKYREAINQISGFFMENIFSNLKITEKEIDLLSKLYGTSISEALYIIYYLRESLQKDGDVCEFGVGNGSTSALLGYEINKTGKKLYLFDSFEGLSKPTKEDLLIDDIFGLGKMKNYEGTMSYSKDVVLEKVSIIGLAKSRVKIIPGFVEDTIYSKGVPKSVCFAYVDLDLYFPTKITLQLLDKVLARGGYIVVDDYGYFSKGVKTAVGEFIEQNKNTYKMILPKKFAGYFCILHKG